MKASVELELAPFSVPDHVSVKGNAQLKQQGFTANRQLHLTELRREVLEKLCEDFKNSILEKAGKI